MRFPRLLVATVIAITVPALFAKDVYLSIAGSVGVFRTDTRILNPSFTKDITITATFLPAIGNSNPPVTKTITVIKRQMAVYDDVVGALFNTSGLGAVRLQSDDDFIATQRIYAGLTDGTLGQFVPGLEVSQAKKKGVVIQMKSNGAAGQKGTFRTNLGMVNPNNVVATVTLRLYDKSNAVVGQAKRETLQPFAVFAPTNVAAYLGAPVGADLSDAWVSFDSDQPIFAYGSVLDNGTTDPTFIPAAEDTGVAPVQQPPTELTVIVGPGFTFTPAELSIQEGDTVIWEFRATHTTTSDLRTGPEVWDSGVRSSGTFTHTFNTPGTHRYYCTLHSVPGGTAMNGVIRVTQRYEGPGYKK